MWSFSFNGRDVFEVKDGRLLTTWDVAANDFNIDVPEWSEEAAADFYDCGEITAVVFEVYTPDKTFSVVTMKVGKRQRRYELTDLVGPMGDKSKVATVVGEMRSLYRKVPEGLRSVRYEQ